MGAAIRGESLGKAGEWQGLFTHMKHCRSANVLFHEPRPTRWHADRVSGFLCTSGMVAAHDCVRCTCTDKWIDQQSDWLLDAAIWSHDKTLQGHLVDSLIPVLHILTKPTHSMACFIPRILRCQPGFAWEIDVSTQSACH